jgi:hypothetical protein
VCKRGVQAFCLNPFRFSGARKTAFPNELSWKQKFPLTPMYQFIKHVLKCSGAQAELNREPRKIGGGPAAVTGDESCKLPLFRARRNGKAQEVG